ncbi:hypothetical protein PPL_11516 [Heterostelium album PN500]|uniref:Uncharacterized protein n=1 Tax=Heterostelium pallidum (strain ATCC 26659 / Pp 5 / PN500) TaxID=670386 RepID=D3BTL9_HETP5|nr:hypothetical protein PPL_11516 [Heterostelium album PN500]EFA75436.1 hypothetical protein PPL_11516 [Heterostelium album PN500]|eukprot:XP_020427570.1 hypothetical protein PPL_11516 [Heterostelium album PN500]
MTKNSYRYYLPIFRDIICKENHKHDSVVCRYNDFTILTTVLNMLFKYDNGDLKNRNEIQPSDEQLRQLKSTFIDFITNLEPESEKYETIIPYNDSIYQSNIMNYLKSFCNHNDLYRLFWLTWKHCRTESARYFFPVYSKLNDCFNIEQEVVDLINSGCTELATHTIPIPQLVAAVVNSNPARISELSHHHIDVFNYLNGDWKFGFGFGSHMKIFNLFKEYFERDKDKFDCQRLKSKLKQMNSPSSIGFKADFEYLYSSFSSFIPSKIELFLLISSTIEIDSAVKVASIFEDSDLLSDDFVLAFDQVTDKPRTIKMLYFIEIYKSRSLALPKNIYSIMYSFCTTLQLYGESLEPTHQLLALESFLYLYGINHDNILLSKLFKMLMAFNSLPKETVISVFKSFQLLFARIFLSLFSGDKVADNFSFLKTLAPHISLDIFVKEHSLLYLNSYWIEFIMLTESPRAIINKIMKNAGFYQSYTLNDTNIKLLLETDNIEFLSLYIEVYFEHLFSGPWNIYSFENIVEKGLDKLLERVQNIKPELLREMFYKIQPLPFTNIIVALKGFDCLHKYFPSQSIENNTSNDNVSLPKLNTLILKEIFRYLILDKNTNSQSILSNQIDYHFPKKINIGTKYCLFRNPPLHLTALEFKCVPDGFKQTCLDNLVSYSLKFATTNSFNMRLINAKNLKHISFIEVEDYNMNGYGKFPQFSNKIFCHNYFMEDSCGNTRDKPFSSEEMENHFMSIFLKHFDNDQLESIRFVTRKEYEDDETPNTQSMVHLSLLILSKFKQMKPNVQIKCNLSTCAANRLNLDGHDMIDEFEDVYRPIVTKLKHHYEYDDFIVPYKKWSNLTKLVVIEGKDFSELLANSPKLYYIKLLYK